MPPGARSYWPSTLLAMKASRAPASPPVTLPPTAATAGDGCCLRRPTILAKTGSTMADIESALSPIQVRRSTTSGAGAVPGACSRAVSATGCWARDAARVHRGDDAGRLVRGHLGAGGDDAGSGCLGELPVDGARHRSGAGAVSLMLIPSP